MKQTAKQRRINQRNLKRITRKNLIWHIMIICIMMLVALFKFSNPIDNTNNAESADKSCMFEYSQQETSKYTNENDECDNAQADVIYYYPKFTYSKDWSANESYLLAKTAMAEAEECDTRTKTLIIMCILNRVQSSKFPNTIKEVIFQKNQFSSIDDGRWDEVEPNKDCYDAVKAVMKAEYDYSDGATYFESCDNKNNWHNKNLEFLYKSEGIRFYKEKA